MDYSKFFRQATGLALMGALAIGCTKDDAGTDGTDSSIMISPSVLSTADAAAGDGNPSGAVDGLTEELTLYFMRADNPIAYGTGYMATYDATPRVGTRTPGPDEQAVNFTPAEYYNMDGSNTLMRGWYPQATSFTATPMASVTWTFTGAQDIMVSNYLVGNRQDRGIDGRPDNVFTFEHMLTQLQFYVYAETDAAAQAWGKVTSIKVKGQNNSCAFMPMMNDAAPTMTPLTNCCTFSGSANLSVYGIPTDGVEIPAKATEAGDNGLHGANAAGIIMIKPAATGSPFSATIEITTQLPGEGPETTEVEIPAEGAQVDSDFAAGQSTKIMLNFLTRDIQVTLMPADWIEVSGENMDVDLGVAE